MGSFLFMALIGLIITTIVNIFVGSSTLEWLISLPVWQSSSASPHGTPRNQTNGAVQRLVASGQIATIGALTLYLDFINLFLYMLRFFGNSRN